MSNEEHPLKFTPPLYLSDSRFLLSCDDGVVGQEEKGEVKAKLLGDIEEHGLYFFFFFFFFVFFVFFFFMSPFSFFHLFFSFSLKFPFSSFSFDSFFFFFFLTTPFPTQESLLCMPLSVSNSNGTKTRKSWQI